MEQTHALLFLLFVCGCAELSSTNEDVHAVLPDVLAKLGELQTKMEELQSLNRGQAAELRTLQNWKVEAGNHLDTLKKDRAGQAAELRTLQSWKVKAGNHLDSLKRDRADQTSKLKELQTNEVDPIKQQLRDQASKLEELQTNDVDQIKQQLRDQASKLEELQAKTNDVDPMQQQLRDQATKLEELQTKTNDVDPVKQQLRDQASKLEELQTKTNDVDQQLRGQAAELRTLQNWKVEAGNHLDTLKRDRAVGRVAFSASLLASGKSYTGPFDTYTTLVYKHVILNFGNAYSTDTGKFTAPVRGVYHFDFHVGTGGGSPGAKVYLRKNDVVICYASEKPSNNEYGNAGNEATMQLEAGDTVFVRLLKDYRVFDDSSYPLCTFSGRLLFPV